MVLAMENDSDIDSIIAQLNRYRSPTQLSAVAHNIIELMRNGITDKELRKTNFPDVDSVLQEIRDKYLVIGDKTGKRYILK